MSRLIYPDFPHPIDLLPVSLRRAFEDHVLHQYRFGVTGPIASGKSHVCAKLVQRFTLLGIPCLHVSYDALTRELYAAKTMEAEYARFRIASLLGRDTQNADGTMNRQAMAKRLFDSDDGEALIPEVERIVAPHVFRMERERLAGFRGLVLVESATLIERGMLRRVGNRVIIVEAHGRDEMLRKRDIDPERAANVARRQFTVDQLVGLARPQIVGDRGGFMTVHANRWCQNHNEADLEIDRTSNWILAAIPNLKDEIQPLD